MHLKSPTTGQVIKIRNPKIEIRASSEGLKDLMHIEEQITGMSMMPDFGYQEDNYILNEKNDEGEDKWKLLSRLVIGKEDKFGWLMNFIKMK